MPRPVEALPWGSRSTIRTCFPQAASAVARLIAVVVLPTPPFWLAIAKILAFFRGLSFVAVRSERFDMAQSQDGSGGIGAAGKALRLHLPAFASLGQFTLD